MLFHLSDVLIKDLKKEVQFLAAFRIIEKLTYKKLARNIFIIYILLWLWFFFIYFIYLFFIFLKTKFGYKFDCSLKLQFSLK